MSLNVFNIFILVNHITGYYCPIPTKRFNAIHPNVFKSALVSCERPCNFNWEYPYYTNGCTTPALKGYADSIWGDSCNIHDLCFFIIHKLSGTDETKRDLCDNILYINSINECNEQYPRSILDFFQRQTCNAGAVTARTGLNFININDYFMPTKRNIYDRFCTNTHFDDIIGDNPVTIKSVVTSKYITAIGGINTDPAIQSGLNDGNIDQQTFIVIYNDDYTVSFKLNDNSGNYLACSDERREYILRKMNGKYSLTRMRLTRVNGNTFGIYCEYFGRYISSKNNDQIRVDVRSAHFSRNERWIINSYMNPNEANSLVSGLYRNETNNIPAKKIESVYIDLGFDEFKHFVFNSKWEYFKIYFKLLCGIIIVAVIPVLVLILCCINYRNKFNQKSGYKPIRRWSSSEMSTDTE